MNNSSTVQNKMDFSEHDLDQCYHTHGLEDPIRIDIPKGGYVPVFQLRKGTNRPPPEADMKKTLPKQPHSRRRNKKPNQSWRCWPYPICARMNRHPVVY